VQEDRKRETEYRVERRIFMTNAASVVGFEVKRDIPLQEVSSDYCWFHPRAAAVSGAGENGQSAVIMTIQQELTASDFYSGLFYMRTDDLGATWRGPVEIPELGWRHDGNVVIAVADVTPGWHAPTGKVIAIGAQVRYNQGGKQIEDVPRAHQTAYAVYDAGTDHWSGWQTIEMPPDAQFDFARNACGQWLVEDDGTLLIPFYHGPDVATAHSTTVFRCAFDGKRLTVLQAGNTLELNVQRGLCEPSLIGYGGRYYLTLRNDEKGYVAVSADGLNYSQPRPWVFDDGKELGSYNTQQHWLAHSEGLFLCYTRRGAHNDHIPRNRAPLFIAQVDPQRLYVIRDTEQVLIPERGLMLGNFGAAPITENESWVTDSEYLCLKHDYNPTAAGGNGSTWVARVLWSRPNRLVTAQ
jgi:hypothetical protein